MKLIRPSYEIMTPINGEEILKQVELAARTCYKSEGKIKYDEEYENEYPVGFIAKSARILIPKLIQRGHEAMLEFGGMITVKFICDRGVSHELVRHRVASFAQESTRYCNYGNADHITFVIPYWCSHTEGIYNQSADPNLIQDKGEPQFTWTKAMYQAELNYNKLIEDGWVPQEARSVLPNSLKTEINLSANIREWRHIFRLRTAKAAHPQMRELMVPLLEQFQKEIPILFDDITY